MHKKKITVLTFKNKKEQPIHILELFSYFQSPRSIDITVSYVMILSVTTGKFPAAAIICVYWYHASHIKMLFHLRYTSLSASNYTSFLLLHVLIVPVIAEKILVINFASN